MILAGRWVGNAVGFAHLFTPFSGRLPSRQTPRRRGERWARVAQLFHAKRPGSEGMQPPTLPPKSRPKASSHDQNCRFSDLLESKPRRENNLAIGTKLLAAKTIERTEAVLKLYSARSYIRGGQRTLQQRQSKTKCPFQEKIYRHLEIHQQRTRLDAS